MGGRGVKAEGFFTGNGELVLTNMTGYDIKRADT